MCAGEGAYSPHTPQHERGVVPGSVKKMYKQPVKKMYKHVDKLV